MADIFQATEANVQDILRITRLAFTIYKNELHSDSKVKALYETEQNILDDIKTQKVYLAKKDNRTLGCIRVKKLSDQLAYIYRFSVDPDEQNAGVGSDLIEYAIEECILDNYAAIALHTNTKYYKLARYYYGKGFYVHSTTFDKGYIRALFVKELRDEPIDLSPAFDE